MYQDSVVQDEEDHWDLKLKEVVEPMKVVYREPSPLRKNNFWLE
jgi:hypothetical protein